MPTLPSIFYHPDYLSIQQHKELKVYDSDAFRVIFSLNNGTAVSLPQGLFGSFEKKKRAVNIHAFQQFWDDVRTDLLAKKVNRVEVIHPPEIYPGFVPQEWLTMVGFSMSYEDINHHIQMSDFQLHSMETRKLKQLDKLKFNVELLPSESLKDVYDFLSTCREEKGQKLNVTFKRLAELFESFPEDYAIFAGYFDEKLVSAVITIQVAPDVVYYFLPGTLEEFKDKSPMVGLLNWIVGYYGKQVKYLDLGVSSIEGKAQEGLVTFKERMGGIRSGKRRFFTKL